MDLHQWITPLNKIDVVLRECLQLYPQILLLPPVPRRPPIEPSTCAKCLEDVEGVPAIALTTIKVLLVFLEALLRNSTSKSIFGSVDECVDLLAAAHDELADMALAVLQALALPPALHKQQAPEVHQHTTALHHSKNHSRLLANANGYGTRASGLGLYQLVTGDDNSLPKEGGQVYFGYYMNDDESSFHQIVLTEEDLWDAISDSPSVEPSKKRRRESVPRLKSTAELYFLALKRGDVPLDRKYALLTDIRMARDYQSREGRVVAAERRMRALICIIYAHPSQEVMSGYFQAQIELSVELVDLLRPTVSSAHVTASSAAPSTARQHWQTDGVTGLAVQSIPYSTRLLALEVLAALVARRDGSSGALSGSARLSTVLSELGVAKGQYLGVLPTLIRYSLASLGTESAVALTPNPAPQPSPAMEVGLAFLEATALAVPPRLVQVQRALEMIDSVLTLTSAVVATPSGTSALTDCGLIPALLATVSMDTDKTLERLLPDRESLCALELRRVKALLLFVTAQAVQILEGAIVTHNNALTAFHDLQGVDVLTLRLSREMGFVETSNTDVDEMDVDSSVLGDQDMEDVELQDRTRIAPSHRVLLFSILTCLTVVFHQENSTSVPTGPTGGAQLRKKYFSDAIIRMLEDVNSYGGHLASLIATLLSDVMNNDPHIVHYVHECGIAIAFLNMVRGKQVAGTDEFEPNLPPVPELIMATPNVLSALSLTEEGAKAVLDANPLPSLLKVFYHPRYAMPNSRCLLNEMTSIIGTGFDEIMRHVERLKPVLLAAIAGAVKDVVKLAEDLSAREEAVFGVQGPEVDARDSLEVERTQLIQYVLNFGQLLEQVLHNQDHCEPFVEAGGLDAILQLYPASMPAGFLFLTQVSSLSSPTASALHHSTIEESLALALKPLQFRYSPQKLLGKLSETLLSHLESVRSTQDALFGSGTQLPFSLDGVPTTPLYKVSDSGVRQARDLASYLRNVALVQWSTSVLASAIKAICQRSQETGTGWGSTEREWKKMLSGDDFCLLFDRLGSFFHTSLFEVCRVRTEEGYEEREHARLSVRSTRLRFRLRIVCPEGAVVRDGIEIDSCANVGSMEMGEVVESFDRCINSSGILRYRTHRGWVSEMTRGHGREPIAEVVSIWEVAEGSPVDNEKPSSCQKRIEADVPDLRTVALGVLARGPAVYAELFGSISKLSIQGVRSILVRSPTFDEGTIGEHVASTLRVLSSDIAAALNLADLVRSRRMESGELGIGSEGRAMYYGCMLSHIHECLFDEKRDRRLVNLPLLVNLVSSDPFVDTLFAARDGASETEGELRLNDVVGLFGACHIVLKAGIADFSRRLRVIHADAAGRPFQRVSRSVASSFPPLITGLRRLVSSNMSSSPVASIMSRLKWNDASRVLGQVDTRIAFSPESKDGFFEPEIFISGLHVAVSRLIRITWTTPDFITTPAHLMYPFVGLVGDVIASLDESSKRKSNSNARQLRTNGGFNLSDYFRQRRRNSNDNENEQDEDTIFEPNEGTIDLLADMGFDRDRALDALENTRSNRVEIAMEYALTHAPPSPGTIERQRVECEERRRRAEANGADNRDQTDYHGDAETPPVNAGGSVDESDADTNQAQASEVGDTASNNAARTKSVSGNEAVDPFHASEEMKTWMVIGPEVCCRLLANMDDVLPRERSPDEAMHGNGEAEALTVVVCSFLLDLCHRFPDERLRIVTLLLHQLRAKIEPRDMLRSDLVNPIPKSSEIGVAVLTHAAVLFSRALPKTRTLVLKEDLVGWLVGGIDTAIKVLSEEGSNGFASLPSWISPALLLLDIVSQPVVGFEQEEDVGSNENAQEPISGEYDEVKGEHESQAKELAVMAARIFSSPTEEASQDSSKHPLGSIPAYFPLLPLRLVDTCLEICVKLLSKAPASELNGHAPPGVAHASLLLLLRLLRDPKNSSKCRRMGVAEAILSLPGSSKFTGNTGLVALVFRRLLEDETTLQAAMETEMRGTISKLQAKKQEGGVEPTPVALHSFIEAVTPMLCRDPASFLRSLAVAVRVDVKTDKAVLVSLVSPEERAKKGVLGEAKLPADDQEADRKPHPSTRNLKSKSPHRAVRKNSFGRTAKKDKQAVVSKGVPISGGSTESVATHVTSLIVSSIIGSWPGDNTGQSTRPEPFLVVDSLLEILTDLVLAIPSCASAVHNYRPNRARDRKARASLTSEMRHALTDCPLPPKTFVNFILHICLPQDLVSIRNDPQIWDRRKGLDDDDTKAIKLKRARSYRVAKSSQAAGRLVLALVARPGEGRKRVCGDLVFALSGGGVGQGAPAVTNAEPESTRRFLARELHALSAWGELCMGVIAPRSTGRPLDGLSVLNVDNIRLLLEHGMVHALLYGIRRIKLFHPMASHTCGTLLVPLECLTRASVVTAVKQHIDKEKTGRRADSGSAEHMAIDSSAIEHGGEEARSREVGFDMIIDNEESEGDEGGRSGEVMNEGEESHSDREDDASSNEQSDEDLSSGVEDSETSGMNDDESADIDESIDESDGAPSDEVEDEGDWNVDYSEPGADAPPGGDEIDDEEGTDRLEQAIDDGWTRIESSAFGGVLLGGRGVHGGPGDRSLAGRRFTDAAEAILGSLLRNGEISDETLAQLEGALGTSIVSNGRSLNQALDPGRDLGDALAVQARGGDRPQPDPTQRGEVIGTLPHIHQQPQPDAGYSGFGGGGRLIEMSSMEFVFGGPSVTGGSRNYDLITTGDTPSETEAQFHLTQLDLQLFPGGPSSALATRTQHSLHPLLCGVDLPPVNSLVSNLEPHGIRATRLGPITTRRPGDWTNTTMSAGGYLISTSNGNIVRSTRPNSGGTLTASQVVGPVGWTDDGLPVDATVETFRSAVERALSEFASRTGQGGGASEGTLNSTEATQNRPSGPQNGDTSEGAADVALDGVMSDTDVHADSPSAPGRSSGGDRVVSFPAPGHSNDGDWVASSLAEGLRLSPGNGNDGSSPSAPLDSSTEADSGESGPPEFSHLLPVDAQGEQGSLAVPEDFPIRDDTPNDGLVCPPDIDPEVFSSLPVEMQEDLVNQHRATQELVAQLDGSSLDPEVLAALPEDMRREVIEQDRRERQMREQQQADPSQAEEMDNASFIASLSPELREEILLTADDTFLSSLPPNIVAEAQILRERASVQQRRLHDDALAGGGHREDAGENGGSSQREGNGSTLEGRPGSARRKLRSGKIRVECDRDEVTYLPETLTDPIGKSDVMLLVSLLYLLSPVRPPRLLQKTFQNLFGKPVLRQICSTVFVKLLHEDNESARAAVDSLIREYPENDEWRAPMDKTFPVADFPPETLLGAAPNIPDGDTFNMSLSTSLLRRKQGLGIAAAIAANLPNRLKTGGSLPQVAASRLVATMLQVCKNSQRYCLHLLVAPTIELNDSQEKPTCFDQLLDLLSKPMFARSSANLDHLLTLLEVVVSPLSQLPKPDEEELEIAQRDIDAANAAGKEWVDVPRVVVAPSRLQILCSILGMETCRDTSFTKVNTIVRRLCRVEMNRGYVLAELASVAYGLGADAIRDLRALRVRLDTAAGLQQENRHAVGTVGSGSGHPQRLPTKLGHISSSVTLSTSSSELKLLRVLQTLQALCMENWDESHGKKGEASVVVTDELIHLLRQLQFNELWDELSSCLAVVQVLEGVKALENNEQETEDTEENDEDGKGRAKLRNSAAGLLSRFLPAIEAFFVANASATRPGEKSAEGEGAKSEDIPLENLVGGQRLMEFVSTNRVLINALVRSNAGLLDKGLRALVQVPPCRGFLDFDVKRQWFKTQMRRLRQQASRRNGSLRLHIRRKYVFEDAYHQLRLRNADEMRGRLHITFRNEEGVDAGGLSREFFGILAKEIFNPNYALFTSTEDGCTFQPNPNSSINPDHLSYFRFVGRIVGKAVADGFLLDAHFTRSLYKHMLGLKPTYHDMEAIDPDYYRNLQTILEFNLADIGLELTFSIEDHSFGRSQTIDLIPNGRTVHVTEDNKNEYVRLVCQHRMTTAIQSQIKAYLDGFYELVNPDQIAIFTPRELELLISGLPDIDVFDLKKNTEYVGWKANDNEIEWFWNILLSLSRNEKASFLQFVTGSSKVPLAGFSELQGMRGVQKFSIHKVSGKTGALMSAHTCFNSLDLPTYTTEEDMRQKFLLAINEGGSGFLFA